MRKNLHQQLNLEKNEALNCYIFDVIKCITVNITAICVDMSKEEKYACVQISGLSFHNDFSISLPHILLIILSLKKVYERGALRLL